MGNELSLRGLQTGRWPKLGSWGKYQIFGPKTEISGPKKKDLLLSSNHVLVTTGKKFEGKITLFQNKCQSLKTFWVFFFLIKRIFGQKKNFSGKHKKGHFSVIPARTRSVVIRGHFPRKKAIAKQQNFFWGWSEWESLSPWCTGDIPCLQKLQLPYKKLTVGPKYPNFRVKIAHFRP